MFTLVHLLFAIGVRQQANVVLLNPTDIDPGLLQICGGTEKLVLGHTDGEKQTNINLGIPNISLTFIASEFDQRTSISSHMVTFSSN